MRHTLCSFLLLASTALAAEPARLEIDARDLPRRLLHATLTIPLDAQLGAQGGELGLWYPQWVPGQHAPGGPLANLAGLEFLLAIGDRLVPLHVDYQDGPRYLVLVPLKDGPDPLDEVVAPLP